MPKEARTGGAPVVFLLFGKSAKGEDYFDEYLAAEHTARIKTNAGGSEIAVSEYDAADSQTDLGDCLDEVFTPALWGGTRLVMVRGVEAILSPAAEERARLEPILKRMTAAAQSGGIQGRLVLVARGLQIERGLPSSSFAAAKEFIRAVEEKGGLCPCIPPYESELKSALIRRAAQAGVKLLPAAAEAVIQTAGTEQLAVQEELDKLLSGCGKDRVISAQDVEALASTRSQATFFTLADRILDGDVARALADLRGLREMPATRFASYIITALAGSFRRYLDAAQAIESGKTFAAVMAELKVPERFQAGYAARLRRWKSESLLALLERALECDVEVKTGTQSEDVALESFVVDACRQRLRKKDLVGRWLYEI